MRKNVLHYLFALLMIAVGASATAAETVQVGQIGGWSQSVVMSLTSSQFEMIYPSDLLEDLGGPCEISQLSFPYCQSQTGGSHVGGHTGNMKIYLANTTDPEVGTAFSPTDGMTLVYDGSTTWEGGSEEVPNWNSYTLTTPFKYTGRNLKIVMVKTADLYSNVEFGVELGHGIPVLFQDAYSADVKNDLKRNTNVMPVTKFTVTPTTSEPTLTSSVYNWKVGKATIGNEYTQKIVVTGQNLTGDVTISQSANGAVTASETTINKYAAMYGSEITLTLTPQDDQLTEDHITISADGVDPIQLNVTWEPKWARPGSTVQVGEDNSALSDFRVPAKLNSLYSKSEFLYTAADLGLGGSCSVSKISFAYAKDKWSYSKPEIPANVKIYLQNTSDTEVGTKITDVAQMTKVYDGSVTYVGTGTPTDPLWLEFEFDEPFQYTGGTLRVVYENTNEIEKTCSYYFRDDYNKHRKALLSYGESATKLEAENYDGQAFPVMKISSESSIKAEPASVEAGDVALFAMVEKEVKLTVNGELNNGITISAPTTDVVAISQTAFTNEEIAAGNGTVSFKVTISPEDQRISKDQIVVSSRGLDDIVIPVTWNPVLGYKAEVRTIGEANSTGADAVEIFTEGGENIVLPITWDVASGIESVELSTPGQAEVFDLSGRHVATATVSGNLSEALRGTLGNGVYVVKAAGKTYKVNVNK